MALAQTVGQSGLLTAQRAECHRARSERPVLPCSSVRCERFTKIGRSLEDASPSNERVQNSRGTISSSVITTPILPEGFSERCGSAYQHGFMFLKCHGAAGVIAYQAGRRGK